MLIEFDVKAWLMMRCTNCPNRGKRDDESSLNDHDSCPIDLAIAELGDSADLAKTLAVQKRYNLVFKGQVGWSVVEEPKQMVNLECSNGQTDTLPGVMTLDITKKK